MLSVTLIRSFISLSFCGLEGSFRGTRMKATFSCVSL
jgi:hypothetical protein